MAKRDWSITAADNNDADGDISIDGTTSSIRLGDNAMRAIMQKDAIFLADNNGSRSTAGSSNAYTYASAGAAGTPADGFAAYATGDTLTIQANHTNTGAATLNVDSVGAKAIRKYGGGAEIALTPGDILSSAPFSVVYDADANSAAGAWILLNPLAQTLGAAPCAYGSKGGSDQGSITTASFTKVTFTTEVYDIGSIYDAANSRLLPPFPCTLLITAKVAFNSALNADSRVELRIYKNGSSVFAGPTHFASAAAGTPGCDVTAMVQFNGSTDYAEIYVFNGDSVDRGVAGGGASSWFQAHAVRIGG